METGLFLIIALCILSVIHIFDKLINYKLNSKINIKYIDKDFWKDVESEEILEDE